MSLLVQFGAAHVQRSIFGGVQGQAGQVPRQPDLVGNIPAHGGGRGTTWSLRSLPTQTVL